MVESLRRRAGRFGLDVLLVNIWEGGVGVAAEEASGYCQRWGIDGTVLLDAAAEYTRVLGVRGVPTNVFVDERGMVRALGATTSEELVDAACRLEPRLGEVRAEVLRAGRTPGDLAGEQATG